MKIILSKHTTLKQADIRSKRNQTFSSPRIIESRRITMAEQKAEGDIPIIQRTEESSRNGRKGGRESATRSVKLKYNPVRWCYDRVRPRAADVLYPCKKSVQQVALYRRPPSNGWPRGRKEPPVSRVSPWWSWPGPSIYLRTEKSDYRHRGKSAGYQFPAHVFRKSPGYPDRL